VYGNNCCRTIFSSLSYEACGVIFLWKQKSRVIRLVLVCQQSPFFPGLMIEFLKFHAHQVFITTRKMYGSIPSFCWYAYFIWLGVQALEMDERRGWKNQNGFFNYELRGRPPLRMLNFYSTHATFWCTWGTRCTSQTGTRTRSIHETGCLMGHSGKA